MLRWAEVKKIIRETISQSFLPLGFTNPGTTMWRYREDFVDVVQCYSVFNSWGFRIELGCHPRQLSDKQPRVWDCMFRHSFNFDDELMGNYGAFWVKDTTEQQGQILISIAPKIVAESSEWFSQFGSIADAIEMIEKTDKQQLQFLSVGINSLEILYSILNRD